MVGWMPCFSQISLIGTCSKRCRRRIFAFSSGLYRLRCRLLMLLFLGRGKVAYLKPLKTTFQLKQNSIGHRKAHFYEVVVLAVVFLKLGFQEAVFLAVAAFLTFGVAGRDAAQRPRHA